METLKKCLNPKVLIGLAIIAGGIAIFAPRLLGAALPLILIAACPLSMVIMMAMMGRKSQVNKSPREKNK